MTDLPLPVRYPPFGQIIRGKLNANAIAWHDPDKVLSHFPRDVRHHLGTVLEFYTKTRISERLRHYAFYFEWIFFSRHTRLQIKLNRQLAASCLFIQQ